MNPVLRALAEGKYVSVRELAAMAGVTKSHLYSEFKRDPEGTVRIGHALRVKPLRARRLLGLEDEQPAS